MELNKIKSSNKGFTLIELIVVMAIIAVLVLLAAPRFLGYTKDTKVTAMQQDTKVLSDAAEIYHLKEGDWPVVINEEPIRIGVGGVGVLYPVDGDKLESSIKNIESDYVDYAIAVDGKYTGQVFHIEGVEDRDGKTYFSHGIARTGVYSTLELKKFESEGYVFIATANDLEKVRNNPNGKFIQVADIDLSHIENFEPIGDETHPFTGIYDGGGFVVSNLTINRNTQNNVGLFGYLKESIIKNIGVVDAHIVGHSHVGSLVGYSTGSTITDSYSTGFVNGTSRVGGLVGNMMHNTNLNTSYSTCQVMSNAYFAGGLVGSQLHESSISLSFSTGDVSGTSRVGGLIGSSFQLSTIEDSYSTGNVKGGVDYLGGLTGNNQSYSVVTNSYSTGEVSGTGTIGGFSGSNWVSSTIKDSYFDTDTSNHITSYGGIGHQTNEMKRKSTFTNWDFDNTWQIDEGEYPTLRWQNK